MSDGVTKLSTFDCIISMCDLSNNPSNTQVERICFAVPSNKLCIGSITEYLITSK